MNLFNRYLMRSCGEAKFQPQTAAESASFTLYGKLARDPRFEAVISAMSEADRNALMEDVADIVARAESEFRPRIAEERFAFSFRNWFTSLFS